MGQQPALVLLAVQRRRVGYLFSGNAQQGEPGNDTTRANTHQDRVHFILHAVTEEAVNQHDKRVAQKEDREHQGLHADIPAQFHGEKA